MSEVIINDRTFVINILVPLLYDYDYEEELDAYFKAKGFDYKEENYENQYGFGFLSGHPFFFNLKNLEEAAQITEQNKDKLMERFDYIISDCVGLEEYKAEKENEEDGPTVVKVDDNTFYFLYEKEFYWRENANYNFDIAKKIIVKFEKFLIGK